MLQTAKEAPALGPVIDLLYSSPTNIAFEDVDTKLNITRNRGVADTLAAFPNIINAWHHG